MNLHIGLQEIVEQAPAAAIAPGLFDRGRTRWLVGSASTVVAVVLLVGWACPRRDPSR